MLEAVIAGRGVKYLMMNAPHDGAAGHRGHPARARVAQRHPARARGHGRGPRGRARGRGPPHPGAPPRRRRVGHPRRARREAAAMTDALRVSLRRVRLADLSAAERRALTDRASTATPGHPRPGAGDRGGRARWWRRRAARRQRALRRWPAGARPASRPCGVPPERLREARDRLPRDLRAGLEQMAGNIERFHARPGAACRAVGRGRAGHRGRPCLARPRSRRGLRARRHGGLPLVAADERHPGPARGRRELRRRQPGRRATGGSPLPSSVPPA